MTNAAMMTVVEAPSSGDSGGLTLGRRALPSPGADEVLIRVAAAGVNRPDILQRMGKYSPPAGASDILGLEVAGEVVEVGAGVTGLRTGDRVCALLTGGGYAEYATAPAVQCLPIPDNLTDVQAAGLPETAFTVWHNVFEHGGFEPGQTVLIHGGSSGIGVMAIQAVTALGGRAIVTVGSDDKATACLGLGAVLAVNYNTDDFVPAVLATTDGRGADIVLDMVGGDYLPRNIAAAAMGGRLVHIAFLRGARTQIDLSKVMQKRLILTGSTLRAQSVEAKGAIAKQLLEKIWPEIERGSIRPVVDSVFTFGDAAAAHALMESSHHVGKIILTPT